MGTPVVPVTQDTPEMVARLRAWFDEAPRWLAERQIALASDHAMALGLEIEAVRRSHTSSANRASQALDRFVCALRNARDVLIGSVEAESGPDAQHKASQEASSQEAWQEPALALMRNFQMQERAWTAGTLSGADFMRGHEILAQDTLTQLSRGLGLKPASQTQAKDVITMLLAPQPGQEPVVPARPAESAYLRQTPAAP
jgi:hypothetical protein